MDLQGKSELVVALERYPGLKLVTVGRRAGSIPSALIVVFVVDLSALPIEPDRAALGAHVHLEFLRCPASFPAVVAVAQPIKAFAQDKAESPAWHHTDVDQTQQRPAELREGIHPLLAEEHGKTNQAVNDGKIAGLDADDKEHEELHVAIEIANRNEHAEDRAETTRQGNLVHWMAERRATRIKQYRADCSSQDRSNVKAGNPSVAMKRFEKAGEEPERKQLEEDWDKSEMNKAVRKGLPDRSMQKRIRDEDKACGDLACRPRRRHGGHVKHKECNQVDNHQATGRAAEFWERKRGGANPGHASEQVNPFNMRVSCASRRI